MSSRPCARATTPSAPAEPLRPTPSESWPLRSMPSPTCCRSSACALLKPRPCSPASSKSCMRRCSPSTAKTLCNLSTTPGSSCSACPTPAALAAPRANSALKSCCARPIRSIHSFNADHKSPAGPARWLLRKAPFRQEGAPHTLLLLADVSVPLQEEEQIAWKRLIRVLGHELSNSLAPIKSIAGSLLERVDSLARRRRDAARFSPRPRRRREPRRIAASLRAVLPAARPVAAAAASAGFARAAARARCAA